VFIVALMELVGDVDVETAAVASLLGLSAYDVRSRLMGGLPRVVLQSPRADEAARVEKELTARGHGVYVCETRDIVSHAQMVKLRRFSFDAAGLWANDRTGDPLPWGDLGAVVLVAVRLHTRSITRSARAEEMLHVSSATTLGQEDHVGDEVHLTHAAYLFTRAGRAARPPWLLEEETAQYIALGARMQPTRHQNFFATIDRFRDLAPGAVFHDRLVTRPQPAGSFVQVQESESSVPSIAVASLDVTVQILARWIMRTQGGPYRG
jgi:hypothetical protein